LADGSYFIAHRDNEDPYHDPDDFVACLELYGQSTLPYKLWGAEPHVLWEDLDQNVSYWSRSKDVCLS